MIFAILSFILTALGYLAIIAGVIGFFYVGWKLIKGE